MDNERISACEAALRACGIEPRPLLPRYMASLLDWNTRVNLTGAATPDELAAKHVADSVLAWSVRHADARAPIIDVGSGGGIPGIVLAGINEQARVTLVERRVKKAGVLKEIVREVGLGDRVRVVGKPFEEIERPVEAEFWFRGFLPGPKLGQYLSESFPKAELGTLVLMKGPAWGREKEELLALPKLREVWRRRFEVAVERPYILPGGAGDRVLVLV